MNLAIDSILLMLLMLGAYALGAIFVKSDTISNTNITDSILAVAVGLLIQTTLYLYGKYLEISSHWLFIILILLGLAKIIQLFMSRPNIGAPNRYHAWVVTIFCFSFFPLLSQSILSGVGPYPAVFFGVDSPWYLQHVISLAANDIYPPKQLSIFGLEYYHHYGATGMAAFFVEHLTLLPHNVFFLITVPIVGIALFSAKYRALITFGLTGWKLILALAVIVFAGYLPWFHLDLWWFIRTILENENYSNYYVHQSSQIGTLICWLVLISLMNFRDRKYRLLAALLVGITPLFKLPFIGHIAMGYGVTMLFLAWREKRLTWLLLPIASALLAYFNLRYFSVNRTSVVSEQLAFEFNLFGLFSDMNRNDIYTLSLYSLLGAFSYVAYKRKGFKLNETIAILFCTSFFVISMPIHFQNWISKTLFIAPYTFIPVAATLVLFQSIPWSGQVNKLFTTIITASLILCGLITTVIYDYHVWYLIIPLVLILVLFQNIAWRGQLNKSLLIMITVGLTLPGVIATVIYSYHVWFEPVKSHEYASNIRIADALKHIPVKNSVVVTNDLRYPAEDYKRDLEQFQVFSIFGHQTFATDLQYAHEYFIKENDLLSFHEVMKASVWNREEMERFQQRVRFTHLLIHKPYPHPTNIPLELIYENSDYQVYAF